MARNTDTLQKLLRETAKTAINDDAKLPQEIEVILALGKNADGKAVALIFDGKFPSNIFRKEAATLSDLGRELADVLTGLDPLI